jgi:diphthamide biosynthesis protein 7
MASELTFLDSVRLEGNPDSVEFCPEASASHVLACGTYTLDDERATRVGKLYLFSTRGSALTELSCLEASGIFDLKWRRSSPGNVPAMAQASSDGTVSVYSLREEEEENADCVSSEKGAGFALEKEFEVDCADSSAMCLSVDWDPFAAQGLSASLSSGFLCTVAMAASGPMLERTWKGHEYEAWVAAYDKWKPKVG